MVETASAMLALGTKVPDFRLSDTTGKIVSIDDYKEAPALLVAFICNHCPFVKHVRQGLSALGRDYQARGVAVVAINSNDVARYP
ncbi:MAG: redoxin domain-containing protein, partial [Acidobacteria bacterium]|nr:redoxin domain-containing protein [Acidobacteriota bacterium]